MTGLTFAEKVAMPEPASVSTSIHVLTIFFQLFDIRHIGVTSLKTRLQRFLLCKDFLVPFTETLIEIIKLYCVCVQV